MAGGAGDARHGPMVIDAVVFAIWKVVKFVGE